MQYLWCHSSVDAILVMSQFSCNYLPKSTIPPSWVLSVHAVSFHTAYIRLHTHTSEVDWKKNTTQQITSHLWYPLASTGLMVHTQVEHPSSLEEGKYWYGMSHVLTPWSIGSIVRIPYRWTADTRYLVTRHSDNYFNNDKMVATGTLVLMAYLLLEQEENELEEKLDGNAEGMLVS